VQNYVQYALKSMAFFLLTGMLMIDLNAATLALLYIAFMMCLNVAWPSALCFCSSLVCNVSFIVPDGSLQKEPGIEDHAVK
jgi:hypothetical protein